MSNNGGRLLWIATGLELAGLLFLMGALVWFHRLTMLAFFGLGIPLILAGMLCYLAVVARDMIAKGAL